MNHSTKMGTGLRMGKGRVESSVSGMFSVRNLWASNLLWKEVIGHMDQKIEVKTDMEVGEGWRERERERQTEREREI